jgi:exosome complex RNA-binding protein Csl4
MEETKNERPLQVVPGDRLAVIEEYSGSDGTYEISGDIRSLLVGGVNYDLESRRIGVHGRTRVPLPMVGDVILGTVEGQQGAGLQVRIYSVNGIDVDSNLLGMLLTRSRASAPCKPGDMVKARVTSTANGMIFLGFRSAELGVIKAWCSLCGGRMEAIGGMGAKCGSCGNVEYRKMAGFGGEEPRERPRHFYDRRRREGNRRYDNRSRYGGARGRYGDR